MQAGMLAEALLQPDGGLNIEQLIVDYEGRLDAAALQGAWQLVVAGCPALRTEFAWDAAAPHQRVSADVEVPFRVVELDTEDDAPTPFERWLEADRRRGFDLATAPLMRVTLFRGQSHDRVVWTFHHILLDGRSIPVVLHQLEQAYRALTSGQPAEVSFGGDFETFLDWLETRDRSSDTRFWSEYLRGLERATPLFGLLDQPDETLAGTQGSVRRELSEGLTARLVELARHHEVTLGTILQGAWGFLLARHHGTDDVSFGVTRSGRHFDVDSSDVVGLLINTVPVRVRLSPTLMVGDFLRDLRQDTLRIRQHEAASLIEIQKASSIPAGEPLFESLLMLEGAPLEERIAALDDAWKTRNIELLERSSFPLVVTVQTGTRLGIDITFERSLLAPDAMERALGQLVRLLWSLVEQPEGRLVDLVYLPDAEREQIEAFNAQVLLDGEGETLRDRIARFAREKPESVAVVAGEERLTYAALDERSNRLAHVLIKNGVRRGDAVAICLDRCADLIVAVIAASKAGASYLPIDTFYPKDRVQQVADATSYPVMVTRSRLKNLLPQTQAIVLFLDRIESELATSPATAPHVPIAGADPAYVIFTSGTTGKPKGVRTTHANVMSMLRAWEDAYRLDELTSHLQMASPSFDVFSGEISRALGSGGKLVLCPHEYLLKPEKLYDLIEAESVDTAEFVPLVLRTLVDHLELENLELGTMRLLAAGADVWYAHEYERIRRFLPDGARLINSYGISETTIDSTYFEGDVSHLPEGAPLPIGRPFGNTRVYILDAKHRPVPIGVVGELFISGPGVTPGYLNDPVRTEERFFVDPFVVNDAGVAGSRMYKTGDLGRFRADGVIEMVGRADYQVKVRGFRIELGEVENALLDHPAIARAVVIAEARGVGEKRLVGYYVTSGENLEVAKLRSFLGERLPYYMVPAALVALDELPRSPNGKVDRAALPVPEDLDTIGERVHEPPRDSLEARLCELWENILGVSPVGIHDDFFELGGHSLLAVGLFARIRKELNVDVPLTALFEGRTVAKMAEAFRGGESVWSCAVALGGAGEAPPLFWIHTLGGGGGGGFFRYQKLVESMAVGRKSYGIRAPDTPIDRIPDMAAFYLEEVRRIQPEGPYHLLGYCFGGTVAYEMANQLHQAGQDTAFLGIIDAHANVLRADPWDNWESTVAFFDNARYWIRHFLRWPREKQVGWLERQVRDLFGRFRGRRETYGLDDFLEGPDRDGDYRRFVETHWEALNRYEPHPYAGDVVLIRTRGQALGLFDPALGWDRLCEGSVSIHYVEGRHGNLFDEPQLGTVARILRELLDPAPSEGAPSEGAPSEGAPSEGAPSEGAPSKNAISESSA